MADSDSAKPDPFGSKESKKPERKSRAGVCRHVLEEVMVPRWSEQGRYVDISNTSLWQGRIRREDFQAPSKFGSPWQDLSPEKKQELTTQLRKIYRSQRHTYLKEEKERVHIGIWISEKVGYMYKQTIKQHAIPQINEAAPGLCLELTEDKSDQKCKIHIYNTSEDSLRGEQFELKAYTNGSVHLTHDNLAEVYFGDKYVESRPKNHVSWYQHVCVHELFHALGFEHTQQIQHAGIQVEYNPKLGIPHDQLEPDPDILGVVRFDPFSIMLYPFAKKLNQFDPAWRLKDPKLHNFHMSELNKVALNVLFPPCKHAGYNPQWNPGRKMYYCKRYVMSSHNNPVPNVTECCGLFDKGPNCPACRTLKHPDVESFPKNKETWQGWSGMIYCWKYFGKQDETDHDGYCGPDYGFACPECKALLGLDE